MHRLLLPTSMRSALDYYCVSFASACLFAPAFFICVYLPLSIFLNNLHVLRHNHILGACRPADVAAAAQYKAFTKEGEEERGGDFLVQSLVSRYKISEQRVKQRFVPYCVVPPFCCPPSTAFHVPPFSANCFALRAFSDAIYSFSQAPVVDCSQSCGQVYCSDQCRDAHFNTNGMNLSVHVFVVRALLVCVLVAIDETES
jgi:hypothetical protein